MNTLLTLVIAFYGFYFFVAIMVCIDVYQSGDEPACDPIRACVQHCTSRIRWCLGLRCTFMDTSAMTKCRDDCRESVQGCIQEIRECLHTVQHCTDDYDAVELIV